MLSSLISNLIWGSSETEPDEGSGLSGETEEVEIEHSASEEAGDWLLITCHGRNSSSECSSHVNSVSDIESICSDGSWVITPAPTFRESSSQSREVFHPLEDLLIEHPTMSVYHQHTGSNINEHHVDNDVQNPPSGVENENESAVRSRELILLQNRQRQQVAMHLHLPLTVNAQRSAKVLPPCNPPRLTRKALRRHNGSGPRGKTGKQQVYRVQKCYIKAGKRRC